jgi:hypothetical protein
MVSYLQQGLCRTTIFPDLDEDVVAVASNDVSVTLPNKRTLLLSYVSVLFVHAGFSAAQADVIRIRRSRLSGKDPVEQYTFNSKSSISS